MGSDKCDERVSLSGDDTMRACSPEEATSAGPGRRSELGVQVGDEEEGMQQAKRWLCFSRVSIGPQRMDCLEQLGRPSYLSWELARAKSWTVTWQHMVKSKMSRICPGEHLK